MDKILLEELYKMPLYNFSVQYIICHSSDRLLLERITGLANFTRFKNVCMYSIQPEFDISIINIPSNMILSKYLDRYFLLIPLNNNELAQGLVDSFFEFIAGFYEDIINVNQNIENITNLIRIIKDNATLSQDSVLLDYGCGTGLITKLKDFNIYKFYGFDNCPTMRSIAEKRGLPTLNKYSLSKKKQLMFDCIYASYVFHLHFDKEGFGLIWRKLKKNGIIIGNFHKNRGIDRVRGFMHDLDPNHQYIHYCTSDIHGAYIGILKR